MKNVLALALAASLAAACAPESDKTNPAVATEDAKVEREAAAPAAGETSFTEDQARERITNAGYSDVTAMTKTADGSWQGTAMMNGQSASVVVDYQGNVKAVAASGDPAAPAATPMPTQPTP